VDDYCLCRRDAGRHTVVASQKSEIDQRATFRDGTPDRHPYSRPRATRLLGKAGRNREGLPGLEVLRERVELVRSALVGILAE
jgi:hypothetical protein